MICELCGGPDVGDSLVAWCPNCTPKEEIYKLSLLSLTMCVAELINHGEGVKLKPGIDTGMLPQFDGVLRWDDAQQSCWLGSLNTAKTALRLAGHSKDIGEVA